MGVKNIHLGRFFGRRVIERIIIIIASIVLLYFLFSLYFKNHFFFNTVINGVDVSLKAYNKADNKISSYIKDYKLLLIERDGETEIIKGQDIGMQYNEKNSIPKVYKEQNAHKWMTSLFKKQKYYVDDLYIYNDNYLQGALMKLNCMTKAITKPRNANFSYLNGSYETIEEIYGNKIQEDNLRKALQASILRGETQLNLNEKNCYENPKYTLNSDKTLETKKLLNKYVSTKITYKFGSEIELLDGNIINEWLIVDENLDVIIKEEEIIKYVKELSKKYDTVGITRNFKTSTGKIVEVKGGLYGWKINRDKEVKALLEDINHGEIKEKEPVYTQKALYRGENEIGNTYVEISITRQHVWFYKDGELIVHGAVVTGNPNRGNATVVGSYMLNYKQKNAVLKGPGYEAKVTYWMPFYGNIGLHDASWRSSFGGQIYKRNGTHGCVNAPHYLAKKVFEYIQEGIPVISYEE